MLGKQLLRFYRTLLLQHMIEANFHLYWMHLREGVSKGQRERDVNAYLFLYILIAVRQFFSCIKSF